MYCLEVTTKSDLTLGQIRDSEPWYLILYLFLLIAKGAVLDFTDLLCLITKRQITVKIKPYILIERSVKTVKENSWIFCSFI